MKICFVAAGEIEIPPMGWGALEGVVWDLSNALNSLGLEVSIVNEATNEDTLKKVLEINPDIVHLHYGKHYELMPEFNCRKIVTNYDGSFEVSSSFHDAITRRFFYDCEFVLLREYEKEFFLKIGIAPSKIKLLPLGVSTHLFKTKFDDISKADKSIYLGKIDDRKRQYAFQNKDLDIDFVGPNTSHKFDENDPHYLGSWTQEQKYNELTEYANLTLLSVSENGNPPLVCLEAMASGLGIVISEASNEGLDLDRKFITVIPEEKIEDYDFLRKAIQENREYSLNNRPEIIEYARQRDWLNVAKIYKGYL